MKKKQGRSSSWDKHTVHTFCDLCIREIERGNRPGTHLTKDGWRNLLNDFADAVGRQYDKLQLKYRWDLLKKDWNLWSQLLENETDKKWDLAKNTVHCSDAWWEEKLKVIPEAKKFRFQGIEPELEKKLDKMFNVVGDLEEYASVPSDPDDLYEPKTRKRRKSEETNIKYENMALLPEFKTDKPNTQKTNEPSKRRKSIEIITNSKEKPQEYALFPQNNQPIPGLIENTSNATSMKQCETKKSNDRITNSKEKSPKLALIPQNGKQIPDLVETKSTATSIKHCETTNYSITDAIRLLDSLNEVPKASPLYYFAIKLILDKDKREVFMALSNEIKVWWLKMEESESRKYA